MVGRGIENDAECALRASDPLHRQGFEGRPPFEPRAVRSQQRVEFGVAVAARFTIDAAGESITAARSRVD